jgi:uncharacterized protein
MTDTNVVRPGRWRDSFYNLLSGLGVYGRDKFASQVWQYTPMSMYECETAYRSDWIARKCVDIPAHDMTRMWRSWEADQDQIEKLETLERVNQIQAKVQQCLIKARLYGGAVIIIGVDSGEPNEPLDVESVGKDDLKWLHVVPWHQLSTGPVVWDITSPYWAQPSWYMAKTTIPGPAAGGVTLATGTTQPLELMQVHPSRVVRFLGMPPPDPLVQIWGDSILQPINDAIKAAGLVTGSMATLISELKIDVVKIPNLSEILSTDAGTQKMTTRFANANVAKSVINTILLDSTEEWQRIQANLSGIEGVLATYLQISCGAADIPASRFLGLPHRGLNVSGEADFRNYYDRLASDQVVSMTPAMSKLDEVIIRSALGSRPKNVSYYWNSLWQMDDTEKAKNALVKAQAFKIDADEGLIPTIALANARINQLIEDGTYPGLDQALDDAAAEGDTVEEHLALRPPLPPSGPPASPGGAPPPIAPPVEPPPPPEGTAPPSPAPAPQPSGAGDAADYNPHRHPVHGRYISGPPSKASHDDVDYRIGTPTKRCWNCVNFRKNVDPVHCVLVDDPIEAQGLCDLYKRRPGSLYNWDEAEASGENAEKTKRRKRKKRVAPSHIESPQHGPAGFPVSTMGASMPPGSYEPNLGLHERDANPYPVRDADYSVVAANADRDDDVYDQAQAALSFGVQSGSEIEGRKKRKKRRPFLGGPKPGTLGQQPPSIQPQSAAPADAWSEAARQAAIEARDASDFNPQHDPATGRFGTGGGAGTLKARVGNFINGPGRAAIGKAAHALKEHQREILAGAVSASLYHVAGLDFPADVEEAIRSEVENFSTNAKVALGTARMHMRNAVNSLIRLRRGGDAVDDILEALIKLKAVLDKDELFPDA